MHIVRTFILRLFIDLDSQDSLRGSVQAILEKEALPFANEQMLGAVLRQLIAEAAMDRDRPADETPKMQCQEDRS